MGYYLIQFSRGLLLSLTSLFISEECPYEYKKNILKA